MEQSIDNSAVHTLFEPQLRRTPYHPRLSLQFLRATAISEFFRSDSFKDTDAIKDKTEALGRAFAFEKATHQYYQAMRDVIGESSELDAIIEAEKNHVVTLMKVILTDAKFRSLSDKW